MRIPEDSKEEFIGQIIDLFENFLEEKEVVIPNDEGGEANICGEDYDLLHDQIQDTLENWDLVEDPDEDKDEEC